MTRLWFKAKRYGYGWYPSTWEGWTVLVAYLLLVYVPSFAALHYGAERMSDGTFAFLFLPYVLVLTLILLAVCAKKGEPARWRWGK